MDSLSDGSPETAENRLYEASLRGDLEEVEQLLKIEGLDINAHGGLYGNALQTASFQGYDNVVHLLLENGANINLKGGVHGTALHAASFQGYEDVVHLLLKNGANINSQVGYCDTALHAASYTGQEHVVNLLLESGADVNLQGGDQGNALQAASRQGHKEVVELLLKGGADVNAQGGHQGNALQAASCQGHKEVVKSLLEGGADVNTQGRSHVTALQVASLYGHEEVVKLLLERGADVHAQGFNALYLTSLGGHKKVLELLLKYGADINAEGGIHGTALKAALVKDHTGVPKLLLKEMQINDRETLATSSSRDNRKGVPSLLDKRTNVNAQTKQHDNVLQATSSKGRARATLQLRTEGDPILDETTQMPIRHATRDKSSESGYEVMGAGDDDFEAAYSTTMGGEDSGSGCEIMSEEDNDFEPGDSTETGDDSSGSGFELMSNADEDFVTAESTLPEHDSPLASLRDRVCNPVEYFDRLRGLAHFIYQHSTLQTYSKSYSSQTVAKKDKYLEPYLEYPESLKELTPDLFEPIPDFDVLRICRDVSTTHMDFASDLLEILECRNVNAQTYSNLRKLQCDGFCGEKFSIMTIDPHRHDVARLHPVDIQQILDLLHEIDSVLRKIANFARYARPTTSSTKTLFKQALGGQDDLLLSVPCCTNLLTTFGLVLCDTSDTRIDLSISTALRLVVNTVDLAVVSYAGAHTSRFDEEYLEEDIAVIDVLGSVASYHKSQMPLMKLSRYHMQCLDSFHNYQPVWVFSSSDWEPRGRLFLSTKVEDFADIWGPLWKVFDPKEHGVCSRYAVGNGFLYKFKPRSRNANPHLLKNETLCHWISNTAIQENLEYASNPDELVFPDMSDEGFEGNETLLIGAVAAGCERLAPKRSCNFDLSKTRSALDDDGRLHMLGTVKEHTYKDTETYQLQVGYSGINVSASKQYKRRGQSLKHALVELWTTTRELRNPQLLQDFHGVEISLCTQNSQRIQLSRILGLGSMRQYLKSFRWKTDCAKQAYFDALKSCQDDGEALDHTWKRHDRYQEDFGRAVLFCLKALEKTGINHKRQLSVLLCSEVTARPELIVMEPKEHSWIGLLKDSENSCCMAVVSDECLGFMHELGSVCGRSGRSVLRTALAINSRYSPGGLCRKYAYSHEAMDGWTSRWSVKNMDIDSRIWLGEHGTLRLVSHLPEATLLMDWRASIFTTAVKNLLEIGRPHQEYSANIRKEMRHTRPIPLFVISDP